MYGQQQLLRPTAWGTGIGAGVGAGAGWLGALGPMSMMMAGAPVVVPAFVAGAALGGMMGLAYGWGGRRC